MGLKKLDLLKYLFRKNPKQFSKISQEILILLLYTIL